MDFPMNLKPQELAIEQYKLAAKKIDEAQELMRQAYNNSLPMANEILETTRTETSANAIGVLSTTANACNTLQAIQVVNDGIMSKKQRNANAE